jgi:hypothetical protein
MIKESEVWLMVEELRMSLKIVLGMNLRERMG